MRRNWVCYRARRDGVGHNANGRGFDKGDVRNPDGPDDRVGDDDLTR